MLKRGKQYLNSTLHVTISAQWLQNYGGKSDAGSDAGISEMVSEISYASNRSSDQDGGGGKFGRPGRIEEEPDAGNLKDFEGFEDHHGGGRAGRGGAEATIEEGEEQLEIDLSSNSSDEALAAAAEGADAGIKRTKSGEAKAKPEASPASKSNLGRPPLALAKTSSPAGAGGRSMTMLELRSRVAALEGDVAMLTSQLAEQEAAKAALESSMAAKIQEAKEAAASIEHEAAKASLKKQRQMYEEQIKGIKDEVKSLKAEKEDLRKQLEASQDELRQFQEDLAVAKESAAAASAELEARLSRLPEWNEDASMDRGDAGDDVSPTLMAMRAKFERERKRDQELSEQMREQMEQLIREKAEAKNLATKLTRENEKLTERVNLLEAGMGPQAGEFQDVQDENDNLRADLNRFDAEKQELTVQLQEAQEELAALEEQYRADLEAHKLELNVATQKAKHAEDAEEEASRRVRLLESKVAELERKLAANADAVSRLDETTVELVNAKVALAQSEYEREDQQMQMRELRTSTNKAKERNVLLAKQLTSLEVQLAKLTTKKR
eukprot:jgi/Mesvir1/11496/Mv13850-RA.2